jgi:hypothetical protein
MALIFFLLMAALVYAPHGGHAATADEIIKKAGSLSRSQRRSFLEEGAKKEGEIVFYASLSLTDYPKIMPHFERAYPLIKTNTYRATPSGIFNKLIPRRAPAVLPLM